MRITCHRNFLIWATLFQSLLFVFMLVSKTYAATETKLLPSDGATYDYFGVSVSVSGNVALVGAKDDDDKGANSGSAYVFRWNGSSWVQEQKLLPSDGAASDYFGTSVSISGDVALVGADWDDDKGGNSGSAYVFRWNGSSWVEEDKLLASDGVSGDWFGGSVSIDGNVALVGAQGNDDNDYNSGSAYVFRWNGSDWVEEQKLLSSDGAVFDFFGESVSISGNVALVGAVEDDDNGDESGSAYVFRWNGSSWVQEQKLLPSDGAAYDWFGESVSISGNAALVGAEGDYGASGSAYVFRWNGSNWVQEQKLVASDGAYYDYFGTSVSISSDVALVGADWDDDKGIQSGSAYVYTIGVQSELIADFSAIPTSGPAPLIVSFSDQSMGTVSSWNWNFGDGTTSNEQNPSHTYTDPGTYTVSLTVTGPGGSDTETKADYITVRSASKAMPWIPLLLMDD